jgi:hypothetical protein
MDDNKRQTTLSSKNENQGENAFAVEFAKWLESGSMMDSKIMKIEKSLANEAPQSCQQAKEKQEQK